LPRPQPFNWAFEKTANLKEPLEELKKQGWRYGDIPTASNFNYLFNEISKWHDYLEYRISGTQDDLVINFESVAKLKKDLKDTIEVLLIVVSKLQEIYPPFVVPKLPG
jgi:hypothetical protein